jgi:hypothetical protein
MCATATRRKDNFPARMSNKVPQGARYLAGALCCIVYLLNPAQVDTLTHRDGFAHQSADSPQDREPN